MQGKAVGKRDGKESLYLLVFLLAQAQGQFELSVLIQVWRDLDLCTLGWLNGWCTLGWLRCR